MGTCCYCVCVFKGAAICRGTCWTTCQTQ